MADLIQLRRGIQAQREAETPAAGEVFYQFATATQPAMIFMGDGVTVGGVPVGVPWFEPMLPIYGNAIDEMVFGVWRPRVHSTIIGTVIAAQVVPTGDNLQIDLVNNALAELGVVSTLNDGAADQETIFASAVNVDPGQFVKGKVKQVGSANAGAGISMTLLAFARPTVA